MSSNIWSDDDVQFLKLYYPRNSIEYCANILNRSTSSVRSKASRLKIKRDTYYWSEDDLSIMHKFYVTKGPEYCSALLNRGRESCIAKAIKLNLKRPKCKTHSAYLLEILEKGYNVLEPYINMSTKILHEHLVCGHVWSVRPSDLLSKSICPNCNKSGFKDHLPAILYFVKINESLFKLGITNRTTRKRLGKDWTRLNIKVIWEVYFDVGLDARNTEKSLLDKYSRHLTNTGLLSSGNTETLSIDIPIPI